MSILECGMVGMDKLGLDGGCVFLRRLRNQKASSVREKMMLAWRSLRWRMGTFTLILMIAWLALMMLRCFL